ncbi:MAG: Mov34/MPN/PAD-1 family protein [Chromatiaceae bacterium]|nr:Mov34/MPN/PAD-1 family protein [Chromatiaceae bacterium]
MTQKCLDDLQAGLAPEIRNKNEGIVYLLGRTDGIVTLAVAVFRPRAETTAGSFFVDTKSMAAGVRTATNLGLQIVAQVHTHPGTAYHSDGDVEGTRIRYTGYSSIVLPDYGRHLPSLTGAAVYVFTSDGQWDELEPRQVIVIPGKVHE